MPISLKTLLIASPMSQDLKDQLLTKLDSLTDDQKLQLSIGCWQALAQLFDTRYKARVAQALAEIREGKKQYSQEDLQKIEADLYREFAQTLNSAQTEEEIQQVRQELQKYLNHQ